MATSLFVCECVCVRAYNFNCHKKVLRMCRTYTHTHTQRGSKRNWIIHRFLQQLRRSNNNWTTTGGCNNNKQREPQERRAHACLPALCLSAAALSHCAVYCSLPNTACCSYCRLHMYCITCYVCALSQTKPLFPSAALSPCCQYCCSLLVYAAYTTAAAAAALPCSPVCLYSFCSAELTLSATTLMRSLSCLCCRSAALSQHAACMYGLCHSLVSLYCITSVPPLSLSAVLLLCLALSLLLLSSLPGARCVFSLHGNWHSLNPISSTLPLVAHGSLNALCSCYLASAPCAAAAARLFLFCSSRINNSSAYKII